MAQSSCTMEALMLDLNRKMLDAKDNRELLIKFGQMQNDEERVIFALQLMMKYKVNLNYESLDKNSEKSIQLRAQGNKLFIGGWDYKAVEKYTESIAYATESSEELALAYANRSAALFRIEKYKDCINDINRALSLEYPDKLKTKLYERKGLCLTALGEPDAEASFKKALEWLDKMSLDEDKTKKLKIQLKKFISAPCVIVEIQPESAQYEFPEFETPNSEVPCASDAVAIKYTPELGRHLVATRKIRPGEILAAEKPFALFLMPENFYTHCSKCLQVSMAMTPCNYCVNAMYCSQACQVQAWEEYHEIECAITGPLLLLKFNMLGLFSMRLAILATQKGKYLDKLRKQIDEIDNHKDPRTKGFSADGKLHSDQYSSVYSLVTNTEKRSAPDLFGRAFKAAYITHILSRESNMFGEKLMLDCDALTKNAAATFVGGLILKHQQIIPSNIHSFGELRGLEDYEHGAAAMPFYSLINHSCDSSVTRRARKDHIILYAMYPIEKGEQIYDNYGVHYALTVKSKRQQKLLEQFYFKCECEPCTEDWPLYDKICSYQTQPLPQHAKNRLKKILQKHTKYIDLAYVGKTDQDPNMLNNLLRMIEVLYELVKRPCVELNNVVETVKHYYALQGNRFDVPLKPYEK
ncbi:SET and MYND domain-containing protein 4-like [Athalia rosae]|uniref:SET and MYND domain-containing protein 4-like n=1 Tax=Athalia rosae TaxID=37344 RepID=UPI00203396A2|nr:SET and MYND domain-containing protein 4-like [Athalia rosae]